MGRSEGGGVANRREVQIAHELTRHTNKLVKRREWQWWKLQGKLPETNDLIKNDQDEVMSFGELKTFLTDSQNLIVDFNNAIVSFKDRCGDSAFHTRVFKELPNAESFANVELARTTAKSEMDQIMTATSLSTNQGSLDSAKDYLAANIAQLPDIGRTLEQWKVNGYNDRLDAMAYSFRDINEANGEKLNITVEQIEARVNHKYFRYLENYIYNFEDINDLIAVADYIRVEMPKATQHSDLITLADYIDANVDKLPLLRRKWAYGG